MLKVSIVGLSVAAGAGFFNITATAKILKNKKLIFETPVSVRCVDIETAPVCEKLKIQVLQKWAEFQKCQAIKKANSLSDGIKLAISEIENTINGGDK